MGAMMRVGSVLLVMLLLGCPSEEGPVIETSAGADGSGSSTSASVSATGMLPPATTTEGSGSSAGP